MAVKCYNCEAELPEDARLCPNCGAPRRIHPIDQSLVEDEKPPSGMGRAVRIMAVGLAVAIFVYGCSFMGRQQ